MIGSVSAQIALAAFAFAILGGLYAGNSPVTILQRALLTMAGAALIGQAAGWVCKAVLADHLRQKKRNIDQQHLDAIRSAETAAAESSQTSA